MSATNQLPHALDEPTRESLAEVVDEGGSQCAAAAMLKTPPSTISEQMLEDDRFAEELHAAEPLSERELLGLMRKHCQKSWQATRWLLECMRPERYCKRKGNAAPGPSIDDVFDAVIGVLAAEVADEHLRKRIAARLDHLAATEFMERARHATQQQPAAEEANRANTDSQVDEQINEQPSSADSRPAAHDEPPEKAGSHVRRAPSAPLLKTPASPPARKRQRQQADELKRLRKQRDKDRKQQNKMRSTARKLKKLRRRPP